MKANPPTKKTIYWQPLQPYSREAVVSSGGEKLSSRRKFVRKELEDFAAIWTLLTPYTPPTP